MATYEQPALKRTSSQTQFDPPFARRQDRGHMRHYKSKWDLQREYRWDGSLHKDKTAEDLLIRSIGLTLEAVGFEAAESKTLESFRMNVEEYMAHYLADVRQSMLSCRRLQPIPQDFLQALHTHQLSLRSLLPHLDPPVVPSKSQFSVDIESTDSKDQEAYRSISRLLAGSRTDETKKYIPSHFPELPDQHTYQATPDYPIREQDPRKVRERATEEGRLGEAALRKLVTAGTIRPPEQPQRKKRTLTPREKRNQMWIETMAAVYRESNRTNDSMMDVDKGKQKEDDQVSLPLPAMHLSSGVNAEKQYWRKPIQQRKDLGGRI